MEMKERQRWRSEEDALLAAYVKQYGPRDWHLVSQRMNTPLNRDAKSCLERWKNYLKPGIKKGSLTEEEQRLVIHLQAKHGNKWKKIAGELPGRTAKRLGKWWEVFKEKQQREKKDQKTIQADPIEEGKYDHILETFAEKLVKERASPAYLMATSNGGFLQADPPHPPPSASSMLPPWLSSSNGTIPGNVMVAPAPSVTLSLSSSAVATPIPWLQQQPDNASSLVLGNMPTHGSIPPCDNNMVLSELVDCLKELDEGHRAWVEHKKEAAWRLRRVELQLDSEKACRRREKIDEIEGKIKALREEQMSAMDLIEAEYREQLATLRRDAENKEQKLAEQWAAKHLRLTKFLEQIGCHPRLSESNGR